jgi:hypothetical protein
MEIMKNCTNFRRIGRINKVIKEIKDIKEVKKRDGANRFRDCLRFLEVIIAGILAVGGQ